MIFHTENVNSNGYWVSSKGVPILYYDNLIKIAAQ